MSSDENNDVVLDLASSCKDQTVPDNELSKKWNRPKQRKFVFSAADSKVQLTPASIRQPWKTSKNDKKPILDWKKRKLEHENKSDETFGRPSVSSDYNQASADTSRLPPLHPQFDNDSPALDARRDFKSASGADVTRASGYRSVRCPPTTVGRQMDGSSDRYRFPAGANPGTSGEEQSLQASGSDAVRARYFEQRSVNFKPPKTTDCTDGGSLSCFGKETKNIGNQRNVNPRLKHLDPELVELIEHEVLVDDLKTGWEDVCGLESTKQLLTEIVVWPFLRPELFHGILAPPKGVLLFGPPGNGKTMIGKCVASECSASFFNISASSLTSKWVGEGEKLVRTLFAVARTRLPAVIFIDEIDSLLSARSETEHESSRRIKTQFLVELDGLATSCDERLLVLAATNRPSELDEAARRRFTKRILVGLPEQAARLALLVKLFGSQRHSLTQQQLMHVASATKGYSGFDVHNVCKEAAMNAIRSVGSAIRTIDVNEIRPIELLDVETAIRSVRPTVTDQDLEAYRNWNEQFGCLRASVSQDNDTNQTLDGATNATDIDSIDGQKLSAVES